MSEFSPSPRIIRKEKPPRWFFNHRKYLKHLLVDFSKRCAYSGQHLQRTGGESCLDIDHFDPTLKLPARNAYSNLLLASRYCNGKKGQKWESVAKRNAGLRFLNPCEEIDYGHHLFEDPETFLIWGATPEGRYHVRMLDLNAGHLVTERRRRCALRRLQKQTQSITTLGDTKIVLAGVRAFMLEVDEMILDFPQRKAPPPPSPPNFQPGTPTANSPTV